MENKKEENENKIILGECNSTMDKMDRDGENKTQLFYRCCSNYALSIFIVDNGLEDLCRREKPDSTEFPWVQPGSGLDRVHTDIKIANNSKINDIMVPFIDHYNAISIDRFTSKTKIGKDLWYFNYSLLCKPQFFSSTETFHFKKNTHTKITTLRQVTPGNRPNLFLKRMLWYFLKILPLKKISQFQDRICFFFIKNTNNNHSSASDWWETLNSVLKRMLEAFLRIQPFKKISKFLYWKKAAKLIQKRKFQSRNQTNDSNLQDKVYQ